MVLSLRVELKDTQPPSETAEQREARRDKEMAWMLEALNNMNHLLRNYGEHRSMTPSGFYTPPAVPPPPVHTPATVTENAEPSRNERVAFAPPRASERILPSPPLAVGQKKTQELQQPQESSDDDLMPLNNSEISLGNFVEQVVGVSSQEASHGFWTSKVPSATQNLTQRRIAVKRRYHKVRKRRMKRDHCSPSLHLHFRVLSPRNQLYLGEDKFNSMAVNMVDENQNAGTRRARFKQRFKQFQKRRSMERYRVVIASFRSKHYSWVVAKKRDKISSHTFSFPPLNRFTVSDDGVLSQTDTILTFDKEFLKLSSLAKEVCELSGVIAKHVDGNCSEECYKGDNILMVTQKAKELSFMESAGTFLTTAKVGSDGKRYVDPRTANRLWEPGGALAEQVLLVWLVDFYGYDGIVDEMRCLAVGVCTSNKQPIDSGRANRVWERGGLVKCDKRFEVLRLIQRLHKIGLQGNETEVLIKWKGLPEFESTWEPVTVMLEQFSDFNLEDKVASLPPGIDRLRVSLAFMRKKARSSGRKARLWEKKNQKRSG